MPVRHSGFLVSAFFSDSRGSKIWHPPLALRVNDPFVLCPSVLTLKYTRVLS